VEFLEKKAKRAHVRFKSPRKVAWYEEETDVKTAPTEFLEMYYLGLFPGDTVIMSKSTARELEDRLKKLEEENKRLKEINDLLKAGIIGLILMLVVLFLVQRGI